MPSINGFAVKPSKAAMGIKTYRVPGTTVTLPVRAEIAPLLIGFAAEFHQKVEKLHKGWCWGYAYRSVRGRANISFHAGGLAIDLNAPRHPLGVRGTYSARQRAVIDQLCKKYGLRAGMRYRSRVDEMHFEVILPRSQALALVHRLQAKPTRSTTRKPVATTASYPGKPVRQGWMNSAAVRRIQAKVGVKADGDFGPKTTTAVKRWQKAHHLRADGIVGPNTWKAMF